jgi:hypothetical protein
MRNDVMRCEAEWLKENSQASDAKTNDATG